VLINTGVRALIIAICLFSCGFLIVQSNERASEIRAETARTSKSADLDTQRGTTGCCCGAANSQQRCCSL